MRPLTIPLTAFRPSPLRLEENLRNLREYSWTRGEWKKCEYTCNNWCFASDKEPNIRERKERRVRNRFSRRHADEWNVVNNKEVRYLLDCKLRFREIRHANSGRTRGKQRTQLTTTRNVDDEFKSIFACFCNSEFTSISFVKAHFKHLVTCKLPLL